MALMFKKRREHINLLDAGAGVGTLTAAFIEEIGRWKNKPKSISVTAYEIDPVLAEYLTETLALCRIECEKEGMKFHAEIVREDFIESAVNQLDPTLFTTRANKFNFTILNPPYRKINSDSRTRQLLRTVNIETSNLYSAFVALASRLLDADSELVAITPRSFCNGPYFKPFRKTFTELMSITRIHVFESRQSTFQDDDVLQENIILQAVKQSGMEHRRVMISSSTGPSDELMSIREIDYSQLIRPGDPNAFIHIIPDELEHEIAERMKKLSTDLPDLGISVSTGRVVDFRAEACLRLEAERNTVPLIYPGHFDNGYVKWPTKGSRKPNAILNIPESEDLLVPSEVYVLVKRFSSKEERKRIVAAVYDGSRFSANRVGFENHLNYFHQNGRGLPLALAKGLTAFLNSNLVDSYFRQFNGHTQVNATDLRSLKYPSRSELEAFGSGISNEFPAQRELDHLVEKELLKMGADEEGVDPIRAKSKIDEALEILRALGLPTAQQNDRSALTLLALLDLKPENAWVEARSPLRGITQMMDFFSQYYGKTYKPNTRESVRRQTVHQFLDAGIIIANPDSPKRPINSRRTVYQIEPAVLEVIQCFGTDRFERCLQAHLINIETLQRKYAQEREMNRIPVELPDGQTFTLSPGGQNVLISKIISEFCERFTHGGKVLYVGDADDKWMIFDEEGFRKLGITVDAHGKMPDVVIHFKKKDWLVLVEAVTSHGPIDPKRRAELKALFAPCKDRLVFVTAFLTRKDLTKFLGQISWETEVWVAESSDHLIHFNGERFLGPY
jgi:adenine-specific DNA-methyltransferase